jgi:adenylyltransferase/sulfurtransferase
MERGDPIVLVDVREAFERYIADLPEYSQRHIPVAELLNHLHELDPSDDIVVYCRSGGRSAWAVQHLLERGFEKSWNLQGGILRWREEVDPSLRAY